MGDADEESTPYPMEPSISKDVGATDRERERGKRGARMRSALDGPCCFRCLFCPSVAPIRGLCHGGWDGWQRRRRAWRTRVRHTRHRSNLASVGQMRLGGWVGGWVGWGVTGRSRAHIITTRTDIRLSIYLSVSGRREGVWHVRPRTRCWIARSLCARAAPHAASLRSIGRPLALPSQSHPQQRGPLPDQTSRCPGSARRRDFGGATPACRPARSPARARARDRQFSGVLARHATP